MHNLAGDKAVWGGFVPDLQNPRPVGSLANTTESI
ncbi:hypothetical protein HDF17_003196 [Granulicella arctica]|uniref:Uncharacterized protein n=1 Tax=Granulicella arctica TaxID=940613 RepID=A0A7Y9THB4_9BACT|nr:hypothetical protein [Granulicella arctica]